MIMLYKGRSRRPYVYIYMIIKVKRRVDDLEEYYNIIILPQPENEFDLNDIKLKEVDKIIKKVMCVSAPDP